MKSTLDYQIETVRAQMNFAEAAQIPIRKEQDFLKLQQYVCWDKVKLYREKQDAFKVLMWEDLEERIEAMWYALEEERTAHHKNECELRDTLCNLLRQSIDAIFESIETPYMREQRLKRQQA